MSLGATFRQAREQKGQTISQVAEATRMMVQIVEDLEREDFRRIAAPIYGRGFIKLYAEHLGLDPEPLSRDFMEIYTGSRPPQVARRNPDSGMPNAEPEADPQSPVPDPRSPITDPQSPVPDHRPPPTDHRSLSPLHPPPATLHPPPSTRHPPPSTRHPPPSSAAPRPSPLDPSSSGEPDLFSVAAGRSEAVRSVADPAQPGESAPPRVRPATLRSEARAAALAEAPARREPARLRETEAANAASGNHRPGSRLPPHWTPAIIGTVAAAIILLLLAAAIALQSKSKKPHRAKQPIRVQRVLPPPAPYFE
ncbi:MAG: helix-turn-helix transcriptional regulator [bacterium]